MRAKESDGNTLQPQLPSFNFPITKKLNEQWFDQLVPLKLLTKMFMIENPFSLVFHEKYEER